MVEENNDMRDFFAGLAMQKFLEERIKFELSPEEVAQRSYVMADWMMEVRNRERHEHDKEA